MKALELLIAEGEGLTIEFKEKYSSKIAQDIVAFANTKGGTILLGLTDNGEISGEKLTNALKSQIVDLGRNCKPAIVVQIKKLSDKVIAIHVPEGQDKPHMCSEGFYKRFDALTQKLTPTEVRDLFRNSAIVNFESNANEYAAVSDLSLIKINSFLTESHSKLIINSKNIHEFLENIRLIKNNKLIVAAILMFEMTY
jgi:ATP-dependent DNA helicase RecG